LPLSMVSALLRYVTCRMMATCGQRSVSGLPTRRCARIKFGIIFIFDTRTHQLLCSISSARGIAGTNQSALVHADKANIVADTKSETTASDEITRLNIKTCRLDNSVL
jgi:hypothetical protein